MEDEEKLRKAIMQAAASLWIDHLPLSKEYVDEYYQKKIQEIKQKKENPSLILKRGGKNGK